MPQRPSGRTSSCLPRGQSNERSQELTKMFEVLYRTCRRRRCFELLSSNNLVIKHVLAISSVGLSRVSCYVFTCVAVFSFFLPFFLSFFLSFYCTYVIIQSCVATVYFGE